MSEQLYWDNEVTGEFDYRTAPETDAEMVRYIPQTPEAQTLYRCYRRVGQSVLGAAVRVLTIACGKTWVEDDTHGGEE